MENVKVMSFRARMGRSFRLTGNMLATGLFCECRAKQKTTGRTQGVPVVETPRAPTVVVPEASSDRITISCNPAAGTRSKYILY